MQTKLEMTCQGFVAARGEPATWQAVKDLVQSVFPQGAHSILRNPDQLTDPQVAAAAPPWGDGEWEEGQVFDLRCEVRWRRTAGGKFTVTCLTEDRECVPAGFQLTPEDWESAVPEPKAALWLWEEDETRIPRTVKHTWGKRITYREFRQQPGGVTRFCRLLEVKP